MNEDPLQNVGQQSHFFLVAQPTAGRRDLLLDLTGAHDWNTWLARLIERAHQNPGLNAILREWRFSPDLTDAHQGHRRAGGVARSSANLGDGRQYAPSGPTGRHGDEHVIELQVFENGGLRLYLTRFSDTLSNEPEQEIFPAAAVVLTRRLLDILRLVAEDAGYFGNWSLAAGANRLKGRRSSMGSGSWMSFGANPAYSEDIYQEATGATLAELNSAAGAVTLRLLGPLLRSLNMQAVYDKALTDTA